MEKNSTLLKIIYPHTAFSTMGFLEDHYEYTAIHCALNNLRFILSVIKNNETGIRISYRLKVVGQLQELLNVRHSEPRVGSTGHLSCLAELQLRPEVRIVSDFVVCRVNEVGDSLRHRRRAGKQQG